MGELLGSIMFSESGITPRPLPQITLTINTTLPQFRDGNPTFNTDFGGLQQNLMTQRANVMFGRLWTALQNDDKYIYTDDEITQMRNNAVIRLNYSAANLNTSFTIR